MRELRPYQVPVLERAKQFDLLPLLLEKRVGKTPISIRWALSKPVRRILVVAPNSAIPDWINDLTEDGQRYCLLTGLSQPERIEKIDSFERLTEYTDSDMPVFYVVNPQAIFVKGKREICETCRGTGGYFGHADNMDVDPCEDCNGKGKVLGKGTPAPFVLLPWDAVLWDESTTIKNAGSTTAQVAVSFLGRSQYKAILTGEIAPEGPQDIFNQMIFLYGHFMGHRNFYTWRLEHFNKVGYDWCPKLGSLQAIKEALHARSVVLTRKDAGIEEQKTFETRYCELPQKIRKAYEHAQKKYELPPRLGDEGLTSFSDDEAKYALQVGTWLSQFAGGFVKNRPDLSSPHKLDLLEELLLGEYKSEKVAVTFRYNTELFPALERLRKSGIAVDYITGDVSVEERRRRQLEFNSGRTRVFLCQVLVAMHGVNLAGADTMFRYSLPYRWEAISQPMDRIVSPMKRNILHYIDLVCKDTVDEDVVETAKEKGMDSRFFMTKLHSRLIDRLRQGKAA